MLEPHRLEPGKKYLSQQNEGNSVRNETNEIVVLGYINIDGANYEAIITNIITEHYQPTSCTFSKLAFLNTILRALGIYETNISPINELNVSKSKQPKK